MKKSFGVLCLVLICSAFGVNAEELNPFTSGATLKWSTSAGQNGSIVVTSVSGAKFTMDQKNVKNPGAGVTKLDGEVKDGKVYIYNRQWNETWVGTYSNGKVTGKINGSYTFTISGIVPPSAPAQVSAAPAEVSAPFTTGQSLQWSTSAGRMVQSL